MTLDQTPSTEPATRAEWTETMYQATENLSGVPELLCPNCGAKTLRILFVGLPENRVASGYIWCDTCLQGIAVSRMGVPEDGDIISHTVPIDERPVSMPDFTIVWE